MSTWCADGTCLVFFNVMRTVGAREACKVECSCTHFEWWSCLGEPQGQLRQRQGQGRRRQGKRRPRTWQQRPRLLTVRLILVVTQGLHTWRSAAAPLERGYTCPSSGTMWGIGKGARRRGGGEHGRSQGVTWPTSAASSTCRAALHWVVRRAGGLLS